MCLPEKRTSYIWNSLSLKTRDIWLSLNTDAKGPCREQGEDRWSPDEGELVAGSTPREREWDPEAEGVLAGRAGWHFLLLRAEGGAENRAGGWRK